MQNFISEAAEIKEANSKRNPIAATGAVYILAGLLKLHDMPNSLRGETKSIMREAREWEAKEAPARAAALAHTIKLLKKHHELKIDMAEMSLADGPPPNSPAAMEARKRLKALKREAYDWIDTKRSKMTESQLPPDWQRSPPPKLSAKERREAEDRLDESHRQMIAKQEKTEAGDAIEFWHGVLKAAGFSVPPANRGLPSPADSA